jgi:hypothetical protein
VYAFETDGIFESDAPRGGRLNKSKAADKERLWLIKLLRYNALQFPCENQGSWTAEIVRQRRRAENGSIVKLNLTRRAS